MFDFFVFLHMQFRTEPRQADPERHADADASEQVPATGIHSHIEKVRSDAAFEEGRLDALKTVLGAIGNSDAFTEEERMHLKEKIAVCSERARELRTIERDQQYYVDTTLKKCVNDLKERENILNSVFNGGSMEQHSYIMGMFKDHHRFLRETLAEAEREQ